MASYAYRIKMKVVTKPLVTASESVSPVDYVLLIAILFILYQETITIRGPWAAKFRQSIAPSRLSPFMPLFFYFRGYRSWKPYLTLDLGVQSVIA